MDRSPSDVIQNILYHMDIQEVTQADLAVQLRISQPAISQYLSETIPLNTDFIIRTAKALGVKPYVLDQSLDWS